MLRLTALIVLLAVTGSQGGIRIPIVRENRIINGIPASQGEFPSQLSLQAWNSHNCGASVLNANYVLTAAHCVVGYSASQLSVLAGSVNLASGSRHQVAEIIVHSQYNAADSWKNDIAVLKLATPLQIDNVNIKPVSLPAAGEKPADGAVATVIGWGRLSEGGPIPNELQKVDIAVVNQAQCSSVYGSMGYPIYSGHICADVPEGNKGSCNGDSGGPLFVDGEVVGLVSWAAGCARQGYPTVYTRVAEYIDWISQQIGV
eukprot:Gregarina_sp_Poly_1__6714@NODE_3611_length_978_cov_21_725576_g2297_i0_p1_GENE_NODE_3611_length_978_cov_21_725576_g2297_i0NODE_3611_length_978_cov_21_725576_g2297_i0_p1_ORF_typecomplete_len259_score14_28Trypsin/PF00089_26/1_6e66Trypsin_2/PF13365_6/9_9e09DUF316/PF03761_15/7_4e05Peptidase_S7/PF00949_21/0_057DUF1986/PF09342_11/0_042Peptidase_S55/PF05580_12/0_056_NODE_3611_length_978_cov_21_725576_g2297_i019795